MKYIIDRFLNLENDAGFKARIDVIKALKDKGYEYIDLNYNMGISGKINTIYKILKFRFERNSNIIIQYPLNESVLKFILNIAKIRKCNLICIIHDIECLRGNKNREELEDEIKILSKFDYIVSHNSKMTEWLYENGINSKIYDLNLFDYLSYKNKVEYKRDFSSYKIAYATGCLGAEKSKFLYNIENVLGDKCYINLYGGIEENLKNKIQGLNNNVSYKGSVAPDSIVNELNEDFGLVWDSLSVNECIGEFAEYTQYNNPHKLSMYIAAGLPVIVWKKSAISRFVTENKIGFCIDNLNDIKVAIESLSDAEYKSFKSNIDKIAERIRVGYYIKSVISKIEKDIN